MRDDFSLSDTGAQEYCEDIEDDLIDEINQDDEEVEKQRERQFFGDEEYTILNDVIEEEDEVELMSMTM